MTDQLRQAAQQALEALEGELWLMLDKPEDEQYRVKYAYLLTVITALRTALKQQQAEPVAKVVSTAPDRIWLDLGFDPQDEYEIIFHELHDVTWSQDNASGNGIEYVRADTTPPQRPWVGLTPEEVLDLFDVNNVYGSKWIEFARTVEAALRSKNT
jgi:hypothetical protein